MKKALLFISLLFISSAMALPARVIIIRHGEKPAEGKNLDVQGYERAAALPYYFIKLNQENPIVAVYAMQPNLTQHTSKRPVETCHPTADYFHVPLIINYSHDDYAKMATDIKNNPAYDGKTVVICWEHHVIPAIAKSFGYDNNLTWPGDVFDATWIISYAKNGKATFQIVSQHLLYGDSLDVAKKF